MLTTRSRLTVPASKFPNTSRRRAALVGMGTVRTPMRVALGGPLCGMGMTFAELGLTTSPLRRCDPRPEEYPPTGVTPHVPLRDEILRDT